MTSLSLNSQQHKLLGKLNCSADLIHLLVFLVDKQLRTRGMTNDGDKYYFIKNL